MLGFEALGQGITALFICVPFSTANQFKMNEGEWFSTPANTQPNNKSVSKYRDILIDLVIHSSMNNVIRPSNMHLKL